MFKKILLIILFLGVTVGVALLLYRFFFAGAPTAPTPAPVVTQPGGAGLPTAGTGRPTGGVAAPGAPTGLPAAPTIPTVAAGGVTSTPQVTLDFVRSPFAAPSGALGYYDQNDGLFYRALADGTVQALSRQAFPQASDVVWAPAGDKAVITFPDDSKVLYDFSKQQQVTIPSHWQEPTFTGDGAAVVAKSMALDPENRWLISMAADGSTTKLLAPLGENGDKVTVSVSPDNAIVAFSDTGDAVGFDTKDLLPIGQNDENFKAMRIEGFGFLPLWSPDNTHLLYSTASQQDGYLPTLWFEGANGDSIGADRAKLGVHTWADKCAFADADTVYCAVPDTLPQGAGLQRDIADGSPDHILRLDLKSGTALNVGRPEEDTSIGTITVASDGSALFFTDAQGHLRQMKLR